MQKACARAGGHLSRNSRLLSQAGNKLSRVAGRYVNISLDDHSQTFNTELTFGSGVGIHAGCGAIDRGMRLASDGVPRRAFSGRIFLSATIRGFLRIRWFAATPTVL